MPNMLKDMPSFTKRYNDVEKKRLMRIKELRDTKNFKGMIESWAEEKVANKILSEKQRTAIYLLCDFVHNFSDKYIYTRVNVNSSEFYKWKNDPLFIQSLDKEITRRRSFIRIHAFRNVHRAIMRGDMKATWNYLKMSGDLKETTEIIDRTGERELSEAELNEQIANLTAQLAAAHQATPN